VRTAVILSLFWFLALAGLGTYFPFYSLYLHENLGLSATEVGFVMSVVPLIGMLVQPSWGHLADRSGERARVLGLISAGAAVLYFLLTGARGLGPALIGTAILATFSTAIIPIAVSTTFALVRPLGPHAFGLVRVWGTVGFFVSVVGFPWMLGLFDSNALPATVWPATVWQGWLATTPQSTQPLLGLLLPTTAFCLMVAAAITLFLPRAKASDVKASPGDWRLLLGNHAFLRLLGFTFLAYFFLQGPMALFPLFVRSLGGGVDTVSQMWIFMLLLEVPLIAASGAGLARVGARGLIAIGIVAGSLRWVISATSVDMNVIFAAQLLHGVTVTGLIIGAPLYVEAVVPPQLRATGQGVLAMVGVSLGGILSNLCAGSLMDWAGPKAPALWGGIAAGGLACALPWILPRPTRSPHLPIAEAVESVGSEI
jgi:PPP family 3-phenylpropionic acid transporter